MSGKIALLVALLTAVITAVVTAPVADKVTGMHGVTDFEGQRGYLVAFLLIPAGFIGGMLLGLLGTWLVHATAWAHFWKALGVSVLFGQVALFGAAGSSLLSVPRPPRLGTERLALEVEVYISLSHVTPRSLEPDQIRLSLDAGPKDNRYARIDRSLFRKVDGQLIVTAVAPLDSTSSARTVNFLIEQHTWLAFDLVALPAAPTADDLEWSALVLLHDARDQAGTAQPSDVRLRYRVVKVEQPASSAVR